jgi:hypothetical protein
VIDATLNRLKHGGYGGLGLGFPLAILVVEVPAVLEALECGPPEFGVALVTSGFELGWGHYGLV